MMHSPHATHAQPRTRVLLTAAEAFPTLERAFLAAEREIWACFRIFDPETRLRSDEGRAIGDTWFDLVEHVLRKGIALHLTISDFDPIAKPELHRGTWRAARMLWAAAELAGPGARLDLRPSQHPARTGFLVRLAFLPVIARKLRRRAAWLNAMPGPERGTAMRDLPGLVEFLDQTPDGMLQPRLWPPPRLAPATHHQKIAVFDRRLLYLGGLDLDERRYDTPNHDRAAEETWHDVQILVEGRAADEAQAHLETFHDVTAGRRQPGAARRLLRTLSRRRRFEVPFFGPEPVADEIAEAHLALISRAERLIYIETQYFRSRDLARALARAARDKPSLGMILMLPAAPEEVAFDGGSGAEDRFGEYLQTRCLRIIRRAFGNRLFVGSAAQPRPADPDRDGEHPRAALNGAPLVYIHAKVSVFDDRAALVTSANLNGRSLKWDTEAGVFLNRRGDVNDFRDRVMAHWLPEDAGQEFFSDATAVAAWTRLACNNARTAPERRAGFLLPHDVAAAEAFCRPLPIIPEEMM